MKHYQKYTTFLILLIIHTLRLYRSRYLQIWRIPVPASPAPNDPVRSVARIYLVTG